MTAAKICGLVRPIDAALAEQVGAAYLGAILASGPRLVDEAGARLVLGARRAGIRRVGVFGHQPADEVVRIADVLDLDVIQLHGERTPEEVERIARASARAIWPVVRVEGTVLPASAEALAGTTGWIVLDALVKGQLGGSGVALDWTGLAGAVGTLRRRNPALRVVLAGGLAPTNVRAAMMALSPDVVDVSSGVEVTPGVKDPEKVRRFVSAVRAGNEHEQ